MRERKTAKLDIPIEPSVKQQLEKLAQRERVTLAQFLRAHIYKLYTQNLSPQQEQK